MDEMSCQSRFSYDAGFDNDIQSKAQNDVRKCDVGCNSNQTTLDAIIIPVISVPIESYHDRFDQVFS
jgi:hypothetical protein